MKKNGLGRRVRPLFLLLLPAIFAFGCSDASDSGINLVDEQGNHPAGWISNHPTFALPDGSACVECHGSVTDAAQSGGTSGVSCFLASRSGQGCHAGGPTFTGVHAVPFRDSTHFQADNTSFAADCSNCHAIAPPNASPFPTAPLCAVCHGVGETQPLLAQSPLDFLNCTSCHSEPPAGTTFPDVAGGHAVHDSFPGITGECDTCHNGLGTGTLGHYNRANARPGKDALRIPPGEVSFLSGFDAKSGPGSFDNAALACSSVSCHGGQTTPDWRTGTIDPDTDCLLCHASGTTQFNGFFSGRHSNHVQFFVPFFGFDPPCLACHDTVKLADPAVGAHFENLVTTAIDTRADVTIGGGTTVVQTYVPGPTAGTGTCTPDPASGCHTTNPTRAW